VNITIIQGAFLPVPTLRGGAVEKLWFAKAREFVRVGHSVQYICRRFPGQPHSEVLEGINFQRVSGFEAPGSMALRLALDFVYSVAACRAVSREADIVVTNTFFAPLLTRLFSGAAVYVDVARMPRGQMKLYTRVARLRATSTAVANRICKELPIQHHALVKTIPNPLPFHATDTAAEPKENIVLYAGRIHSEKGIHLLAKASFALETAGWRLFVVGPSSIEAGGEGASYLERLKGKFSTKTEFLGPIFDDSQLSALYARAKIFVYPSLATAGETFGLSALEAMAHGAVPVVSDLECFGDFIIDGVNGMVFQHQGEGSVERLSERIMALVADNGLRCRLEVEARKVRASHGIESISAAFLEDFSKAQFEHKN